MDIILKKLNMEEYEDNFRTEMITPDIVCKLTRKMFASLGLTNSADIMKLRVECVTFGKKEYGSKYEITPEIIRVLLDSGFPVKDMADLLNASQRTLYRRMSEYNLQVHVFSDIDDQTLDFHIGETVSEFPRCGEKMLREILRTKGIKVQRSRLRRRLHLVDKDGIAERHKRRLHRRVYDVLAPNHMWHIDTNHKLIRWKFVICGGVDGFSRFIVFLKCTNNNTSRTIFAQFIEAVNQYGLPINVRSDMGMENIEIAQYMLSSCRNMITGKSTHNQRIERLWRDVYNGVLSSFYEQFYSMEDEGILNPLNEQHIFALHYIFMPNINKKLNVWKQAWARHRIRTVNSSPQRLFLAGSLNNENSAQLPDVDIPQIDYTDNSISETQEAGRPIFEEPAFNISQECMDQLKRECTVDFGDSLSGIPYFQIALRILSGNANN